MPDPSLRGDCARCAALCCVAVAFDRSESFAFDKPADTPCGNLDGGFGCALHARLADEGFRGCAAYDCYGAGQIVTQQMFGGRTWRDDPALLPAMSEAFRRMRRVQELRLLLDEARRLALGPGERQRLEALDKALAGDDGWRSARREAFGEGGLAADVGAFLRSLAAGRDLERPERDRPSEFAA
jgi:hypothetical protein